MTYSIWLEPSVADRACLKKIIAKLAKEYGAPVFLPHITVYGGVKTRSLAIEAAQNCKDISRITVSTKGIRFSDFLWKTLYVEIRNNSTLTAIHKQLGGEIPTKYDFEPHLSLIYKKMPRRVKLELRKKITVNPTLTFDRITVIRSGALVKNWERVFTARLR